MLGTCLPIAKAHCGSNLTVFQRIDYDKVDRLIRSDSRNKILVRRDGKSKETKSRNQLRWISLLTLKYFMDCISHFPGSTKSRSIVREKPNLNESVSREVFRLTPACPNICRDQLTTYCRSYT
ncbi:hypothetical protein GCK72_022751 [Caenorhabditis remanei]|uniref:Uncharacterized protein n=1 Tax=Caenorhabditis remanei TaxID=31234 RepID=A0A6A5FUJ3_CAERE|nr:hypothetical protein GCK72_022751 [Caenorhabditis remanei]KAF1746298.1 hypothetical protein GCK72_022751 [Caenorhabditis remanei]